MPNERSQNKEQSWSLGFRSQGWEMESCFRLHTVHGACLRFSRSLSRCSSSLPFVRVYVCSLSKKNKILKNAQKRQIDRIEAEQWLPGVDSESGAWLQKNTRTFLSLWKWCKPGLWILWEISTNLLKMIKVYTYNWWILD